MTCRLFPVLIAFSWALQSAAPALASTTWSPPFTVARLEQFLKETGIDTLDALVAAMPDSIKLRTIPMVRTGSPQGASTTYPRIILRSEKAEFSLAFSLDPESMTFGTADVLALKESGDEYEVAEVSFKEALRFDEKIGTFIRVPTRDEEMKSSQESARVFRFPGKDSELPLGTSGHGNKPDCRTCHGKDPRVIFDPYKAWPGMLPFFGDAVIKDTPEAKVFVALWTNREKLPAFRHLTPPKPIRDGTLFKKGYSVFDSIKDDPRARKAYDNPLERNSYAVEPGIPTGGQGAEFIEGALFWNGKRIARSLREHPSFDRLKYALVGALYGCYDFQDFFPPEILNRNLAHFEAKSLKEVENSTAAAEKSYFAKQLNEQRKVFGEKKLPFERYLKPVNQNNRGIALSRFLLEPEGIDVSEWSLSVLPRSYAFGDVWRQVTKSLNAETLLQGDPDDAGKALYDSSQASSYRKTPDYGLFKRSLYYEKFQDVPSDPRADYNLSNYLAYRRCNLLKGKSLAALTRPPSNRKASDPKLIEINACFPEDPLKQSTKDFESRLDLAVQVYRFPPACIQCHTGEAHSGPSLPLDGMKWLELSDSPAKIEQILVRINSKDEGRMPPPPSPPLSDTEREAMEAVLQHLMLRGFGATTRSQ